MSRRDDVWRAFLGRDPNPAEEADKLVLAEHLVLGENDPFWGVVAFMYARLPGMAAEHERLRITRELVNKVSGRLDDLPEMLQSSVHAVMANGLMVIGEHDVRLCKVIEPGLSGAKTNGKTGHHNDDEAALSFHPVWSAVAELVLVGALLAGTWVVSTWRSEQAFADQQAMTVAQTHTVEAWAKTWEGHEMYVWSRLNGTGMNAILRCDFGDASKVVHGNGMAICYPAGSAHGYYLPGK
jgi:hypothetical protein